jgi:serine protease Do
MSALTELAEASRTVVAAAAGGTVAIGRDGRGTGIVIAEGRVLTNAHNLRDRTTQVTFADGRVAQAEVTGSDVDGDLTVLAVDTTGATPLQWAEAEVDQGDWVFALASGGLRGVRVTSGSVSARGRAFRGPRGRRVAGSVEHTAPLARGSSGGPLLDATGKVVGLNTHRVERGFYLARPADAELRDRVAELAAGVSPVRRRLGVALAPAGVATKLRTSVGLAARDGVLVAGVEDGSPAAAAGLARGDLVVRAGARVVATPDDLHDALADSSGGDTLELGVVRGAEELTLTVSFRTAAPEAPAGSAPDAAVGDTPS